ncbi:MAG TPA: hypothetical protein VGB10_02525 [Bacteroidota bacterium]
MRKVFGGILVASLLLGGCMTHMHVVGDGGKTASIQQERQWYVLWGLVPINTVNTAEMTKGATNYTIKTEQTALDVIINIFTSAISVTSRTVEVRQ